MSIKTVLLFGQDPFTEKLLGMLPELDADIDARLMRNASPAVLTHRDLDGVQMLLLDGDRVTQAESRALKERTAKLPHLAIAAFGRMHEPKKLVILPGGHFDAYVAGFAESSGSAIAWFRQWMT